MRQPLLPKLGGAHPFPQPGQVGGYRFQHRQPVLGYQPVGVRHPAQGIGQVAPLLLNHPQLPAGAGGAQRVARLLKGLAGLVVPVISLVQVALFVMHHGQLARFNAHPAPVAQLLAVLHCHPQPFLGLVGDAPRLRQRAQVVKLHHHLAGHT